MKNAIYLLIILLCLLSCDCTYQYGVIVRNSTGEELTVAYKTKNDIRGETAETVTLKDGEQQWIINTIDIAVPGGCTGTTKDHHPYVAEYVRAYIRDGVPSTINWYDERIKFEKTDIQQAEFTIEYTAADF